MQLREENQLCKSSVMVTAGANQVIAGRFSCFIMELVLNY